MQAPAKLSSSSTRSTQHHASFEAFHTGHISAQSRRPRALPPPRHTGAGGASAEEAQGEEDPQETQSPADATHLPQIQEEVCAHSTASSAANVSLLLY